MYYIREWISFADVSSSPESVLKIINVPILSEVQEIEWCHLSTPRLNFNKGCNDYSQRNINAYSIKGITFFNYVFKVTYNFTIPGKYI